MALSVLVMLLSVLLMIGSVIHIRRANGGGQLDSETTFVHDIFEGGQRGKFNMWYFSEKECT